MSSPLESEARSLARQPDHSIQLRRSLNFVQVGGRPKSVGDFPFSVEALPIVPTVIRGHELPDQRDAFAFLEWCPVRGTGAVFAGGVMGFMFGAVFAGYSSLAPYDPALRDWQLQQARIAAAEAAAKAPTGTAASAAIKPSPFGVVSPSPFAPTLIPGVTAPHLPRSAASLSSGLSLPPEPPSAPFVVQVREGLAQMKERSFSSARNFAVMGGIFTTTECFLEQVRGKKDIYNAIGAGFATGSLLAYRAGPAAIVIGGAGFAAFSAIIDLASPYLFNH
jgi:hypothetical protein